MNINVSESMLTLDVPIDDHENEITLLKIKCIDNILSVNGIEYRLTWKWVSDEDYWRLIVDDDCARFFAAVSQNSGFVADYIYGPVCDDGSYPEGLKNLNDEELKAINTCVRASYPDPVRDFDAKASIGSMARYDDVRFIL